MKQQREGVYGHDTSPTARHDGNDPCKDGRSPTGTRVHGSPGGPRPGVKRGPAPAASRKHRESHSDTRHTRTRGHLARPGVQLASALPDPAALHRAVPPGPKRGPTDTAPERSQQCPQAAEAWGWVARRAHHLAGRMHHQGRADPGDGTLASSYTRTATHKSLRMILLSGRNQTKTHTEREMSFM